MPTKSILKILDHSIRLNEANVYAAAAEVIMLNKTYFISPVKVVIKFTRSLPHNLNKGCPNCVCVCLWVCVLWVLVCIVKSCSIRIIAPLLFGKDNFTCNTNNLSRGEAGLVNGMHFTAHLGSARNRKQMVLAAGFPLEPAHCQPVVFSELLLADCDLNIVGQWQKKSNLFQWAASYNEIWQIWHSIPNI